MNPVDECTRPLARPEDLGPKSTWQKGPAFLSRPRDQWPLTVVSSGEGIPPEEMKDKKVVAPELVNYVEMIMQTQEGKDPNKLKNWRGTVGHQPSLQKVSLTPLILFTERL